MLQLIVMLVMVVFIVLLAFWLGLDRLKIVNEAGVRGGACKKNVCGGDGIIDDVSNPAYNMQEIVKQSLLLEEHLVEPNKRCIDCIKKHFLTIIAYSEEAMCLAGSKVNSYPFMSQSVPFYKGLFDTWMNKKQSDAEIATVLREKRKMLMEKYFVRKN